MKADFETVGKRMPYVETEEYVSRLVDRCADRAIARSKHPARSVFSRSIGIAATSMAAALIAAALIIPVVTDNRATGPTAETIAQSSSLSDVLSAMSNDELAALDYYSFDDLPSDYDENEE